MSPSSAFKALADPTRRHILKILQKGDLSAGEIADNFNISKPSISHHLNILKQANLVQDYRNGQNIYYSLNTTVLQDIVGWFYEFINPAEESQSDELTAEEYKGEGGSNDK